MASFDAKIIGSVKCLAQSRTHVYKAVGLGSCFKKTLQYLYVITMILKSLRHC